MSTVALRGLDIAVLAGAGAFALLVLLWMVVSRVGTGRRLAALALRLEPEGGGNGGRGLERKLSRVERAAEDVVARVGEARVAADRMAQALETVQDGVVVCDDGGEVVVRNERARQLLTPGPAEEALAGLVTAALAGTAGRTTVDVPGPAARTLVIEVAPADDSWRTIGAVAVVADESDRRRVDAVRRDFVENATRELHTPLAGLAGLAETLAAEGDRAVAARLAERIAGHARRLSGVVDNLIDLSRLEVADRPGGDAVSIATLVGDAVDRVRPEAERRKVGIDWTQPSHRLTVLGDRRQLASALGHLLENAVRHSKSGSTVEVGSRSDGAVIELAVRDRGPGIAPRHLGRVFERFYRVDRKADGGGLGLAIVRHVATSHGGEVLVHSKEGEGSTFVLRLPAPPGPVAIIQAG